MPDFDKPVHGKLWNNLIPQYPVKRGVPEHFGYIDGHVIEQNIEKFPIMENSPLHIRYGFKAGQGEPVLDPALD